MNYFSKLWQNHYVRKTAKGSFIIFAMMLLASVIGYAIRLVLSRQLSLEDFGLFYAVFTFVTFFVIVRDFGLNQALIKFIPEFNVKNKLSKIKSIALYTFLTSLASLVIVVSILAIISKILGINYFHNALAQKILIFLLAYFVFDAFSDFFAAICLGFHKYLFYSMKLFLTNSCVIAGLFIFKDFGIMSPVIAYILAAFLTVLIYLIFFKKSFTPQKAKIIFSSQLYKKIISFGLPVFLTNAGNTVIGYISILILTYFRPLQEVGVYNIVQPTAVLFTAIAGSIAIVLMPIVSEMLAENKKEAVKTGVKIIYKYLSILLIIGAAIIFIFSESIIKFLFGEQFLSGAAALRILIIAAVFISFAFVNNSVITARGKPLTVTKIVITAAIMNFAASMILVPLYGMNGAAAATLLSSIIMFIVSFFKLDN